MTIRSTVVSSVVFLFLGLSASGCGSGGDGNGSATGGATTNGGAPGGGGSSASSAGGSSASGGGSGTLTPAQFGEKYKFSASDLAGWAPADPATDVTAYNVYNGEDELVGRIDGGDIYTPRGCRVSMFQDLVGPDPEICTLVAMDFVTSDNATVMFTYKKDNGASLPIPGYDASVALGSSTLGGINAFAHINASYFEVQLSGFANLASASAAAQQFLDVLKAKTN